MEPPGASRAVQYLSIRRIVLDCLSALVAIHCVGGQEPTVQQCPVDLSLGNFRIHNESCYSTFLPAPDDSKRGQEASAQSQLRPSALLQVSLLSLISNAGEETLCGFDQAVLSNRTTSTAVVNSTGSAINGTLVVRSGIDRRWLMTSVFFDSTLHIITAWTNAQLRVIFDSSCAGSRDQLFVHQSVPAWSICRQVADVSRIEFEQWNDSVIFAQDRRLSQWLPLPTDYECVDGKDYELTISSANPSSTLSITFHSGPGFNSCRSLCIAEQCNIAVLSSDLETMAGNRSITVRYKYRPADSICDSLAYSGFSVVIQVQPASSITLTTRVLDSLVYPPATTDSSGTLLLIAVIVAGVIVLGVVAVIVTITVRRKLRNTQQNVIDNSLSAHGRATADNKNSAATLQCKDSGNSSLRRQPASSTTAAFGSGQHDHSPAVALPDPNSDGVYAHIDDEALSAETPTATTISGRVTYFKGKSSLANSHQVAQAAPTSLKSNDYCGLGDRLDVESYSVPHKCDSNDYCKLGDRLDVEAYSVLHKCDS